jgi:hypothetical protein
MEKGLFAMIGKAKNQPHIEKSASRPAAQSNAALPRLGEFGVYQRVKVQIKIDVLFAWNLLCPNAKSCQHVLAVWRVWINPLNNCVEMALECNSNRWGLIQHPPHHNVGQRRHHAD